MTGLEKIKSQILDEAKAAADSKMLRRFPRRLPTNPNWIQ